MLSSLLAADKIVYELILRIGANNLLQIFLPFFSLFGETLLWLGVVAFLFFKKQKKISLLLLAGLVIDLAIVYILKTTIPRTRPIGTLGSFPSGHVSKAFLGWTILSEKFHEYALPLYALTILTLVSRIYTGMHYPTDTAVGAAIGFGVGKVMLKHQDTFYAVLRKLKII